MRETREIKGHLITFQVAASDAATQRGFYTAKIDGWAAGINAAPAAHVGLLAPVPIIVVDRLGPTRDSGSGWYPPRRPGYPLASIWRNAYRIRECTHVPESVLDELGIDHGIIGVTRAACRESWWQFSPLHEMGHCIDWHSTPSHNGLIPPHRTAATNPAYRAGNAPYQGQRYTNCTGQWNPACISERAAEAYSRYLISRRQMCRGAQGTPRCVSHGEAACNRRLLRDLQSTPAFSGISITTP
jgi:hypothetical protein